MEYTITSLHDREDLYTRQSKIITEAWPTFMLNDLTANKYWSKLINENLEYQLLMMYNDEILAVINSVPIYYNDNFNELPDKGWDWGVEKAIHDKIHNIEPNMLLGLNIAVNKAYQGMGLSSLAVKEMSMLAKRLKLSNLIIPVRPSNKHTYPLQRMDNYITWENEKKLPFDSWLRVHVRAGGKIINICNTSMFIPGTVSQWKVWTGLNFIESGEYIVPGALNPVSVDIEKDTIQYTEPNVWVLHSCT